MAKLQTKEIKIVSLAILVFSLVLLTYSHRSSSAEYLTQPQVQWEDEMHPMQQPERPSTYSNTSHLLRRDDDTCHKGTPCETNACCGSFGGTDTGICGLGPTFCGSDCDSQCDAKAECGQFADPPGKTCPLNVCCSQYGFCGSTDDFCSTGCQSNCELNVTVPAGGSEQQVLQNRVIGYYESWSARSACHGFPPSAIPADGLTHVNFAFASIDPESLQIVPMDTNTPEGLFAQMADIKSQASGNMGLQIFISIGGWTFSDNGTATQPLFSSIAADGTKRQKFADNLVAFMTRYGFDGVDIDWEYPGAPDRGGLEQYDTINYVQLLKTLRETFQASPRGNYGISFTIPTSYWYLRWFDVPGLLEYADWTNMMAYDLSGTWDASDSIGSIIQAHTNLTDIKLAMDLLWRSNVPPSQIVLGLGFYGRSFQLADKACSTPGCTFKGPADAGACTNNAGTLAYFEIMDTITKEKPIVVHDEAAAVNYFTYGVDQDQWISYDNATTFKQKVDWANSIGLGGVMIWSIDQDDTSYSALEGLLGKSLHAFAQDSVRSQTADTDHWTSLNGQACKVTDCLDSDTPPPAGYAIAPNGKYPDTCGSRSKFVYCPVNATPQSCQWRGSGSCHGQCHPGEVTLAHSPYGDQSCLAPGMQALCCISNTWAPLVDKCAWSDGCADCPADSHYAVSTRRNSVWSSCQQSFCCPYNFENCHWVGQGTCDDNECGATDVQVGLDQTGDNGQACVGQWATRQKALCCNAPKNLNFFLPAQLEDLFPTLPPSDDIPAFDQQTLTTLPQPSDNNGLNGFFLVVIDGPADAVTNLNKRDGSHIQFVTGPVHHGQASQTAHFVCMDDSLGSNCDDMHLSGLEGTIIRLPDHLGFAQWGVAHAVRSSNYTVPRHLLTRAPASARIMELEYSYDFSKVKRDSGPIYLRVDYSDDHKYYTDVVMAPHQKKRDLHPRFWSKVLDVWKTIIANVRGNSYAGSSPTLIDDAFDVLLVGDDGHTKTCTGADGFLRLDLAGNMRSAMKWGYTIVGTIQPFNIEEAYGYFDSDMYMSAQLYFDGRGYLDLSSISGLQRNLLATSISNFGASHPGIVQFTPQLNAEISLTGSGEIDGQFSVNFETGSLKTMTTNAPPTLGSFDGDIIHTTFQDSGQGYLWLNETVYDTVFAVNVNLESLMNLQVFGYESTNAQAGANFASRTPHAIRVMGNDGTGRPAIADAPQQASSDVVQEGTLQDGWDDGTTHLIGTQPNPILVFSGGDPPPDPRKVPPINGYALFGDHQVIDCSSGSMEPKLVCTYNITANDSSLVEPDPPYKLLKRGDLNLPSLRRYVRHPRELQERQAGPSAGSKSTYYVMDQSGDGQAFEFITPNYPQGDGGEQLDSMLPESSRGKRRALADPSDCINTDITTEGVAGVNYDSVDTEHPIERSLIANEFANFVQLGTIHFSDDQHYVSTSARTFTFDNLLHYWSQPYEDWVPRDVIAPPGSAMSDTADALGSTGNPNDLTNLDHNLNVLKGMLCTDRGRPPADAAWNPWMRNPTAETAQAAFSALRAVFAVFNYINSISVQRQSVLQTLRAAQAQFDTFYGLTFPERSERMADLHDEFWPVWDRGVARIAQGYVNARLDAFEATWQQQVASQPALAQYVLDTIKLMRDKVEQEIKL